MHTAPEVVNPSNRLKTLQSLLYTDHKTGHANAIATPSSARRDLQSASTDYSLPRNLSAVDLNHGFIIQPRKNHARAEPRQINSWDDI